MGKNTLWKFSRKQCLQYLVKWDRHPDSDNMWVNKDAVFADNKVWEFKNYNPNSEVHLRKAHVISHPYPPTPIPHQLHCSLILNSPMSSNGHSNCANKYTGGAHADNTLLLDLMLPLPLTSLPCLVFSQPSLA
jgi:hypothetical protein